MLDACLIAGGSAVLVAEGLDFVDHNTCSTALACQIQGETLPDKMLLFDAFACSLDRSKMELAHQKSVPAICLAVLVNLGLDACSVKQW